MRILLTGGAGDLGQVVGRELVGRGDKPVKLDLRRPARDSEDGCQFVAASILDRELLGSTLRDIDCVVHIAAWHGIHEFRGEKDAFDFWELNVDGTMTLLECCARAKCSQVVFISSTSVGDWPGIYAHSKLVCEDLMRTYMARHGMRIISLRPRAFIPHWNRSVYSNFSEWAKWYWKGAVHIEDVAQAVVRAVEALSLDKVEEHLVLTVDGAYEFSPHELENWDLQGKGSTFKNRFGLDAYELMIRHGLDPAAKPHILGYCDAQAAIGYEPQYNIGRFLEDLALHHNGTGSVGMTLRRPGL